MICYTNFLHNLELLNTSCHPVYNELLQLLIKSLNRMFLYICLLVVNWNKLLLYIYIYIYIHIYNMFSSNCYIPVCAFSSWYTNPVTFSVYLNTLVHVSVQDIGANFYMNIHFIDIGTLFIYVCSVLTNFRIQT